MARFFKETSASEIWVNRNLLKLKENVSNTQDQNRSQNTWEILVTVGWDWLIGWLHCKKGLGNSGRQPGEQKSPVHPWGHSAYWTALEWHRPKDMFIPLNLALLGLHQASNFDFLLSPLQDKCQQTKKSPDTNIVREPQHVIYEESMKELRLFILKIRWLNAI